MRIIKVALPATLHANDPNISLASDELRAQIFRQIEALDYELSELVRHRAVTYFPSSYSVFVRTRSDPEHSRMTTELWIVDPTVRWPQGLLTRRAWLLFVPVLAHIVQDVFQQRMPQLSVEMNEKDAKVTVLAPTRSWRDPVILSVGVVLLTTLFWTAVYPRINQWLGIEPAQVTRVEAGAHGDSSAAVTDRAAGERPAPAPAPPPSVARRPLPDAR